MTRVDFYVNAESRLHVGCQLTAKAFAQKMHVIVFAPDDAVARAFDRLLWTFQAISFIPHCRVSDPLARETPVLIAPNLDNAPHDELLVNLDDDNPAAFSRFQREIGRAHV
jgi:DNA polymerase-3 subunit chi